MEGETSPVEPISTHATTQEKVNNAIEEVRNMTPQERAGKSIGAAKKIIDESVNQGLFDQEGNQSKKEVMQKALSYKGAEVNEESSQALKAIVDTLDVVGTDVARGIKAHLLENLRIKANIKGEENFFTPDEWQKLLKESPQEIRESLDRQGLYGFLFPPEQEIIPSSKEPKESLKSPEDKLITGYIETIKQEVEKLKQASQDTKKQEELLIKLTIAQKANGKGGFVFKMEAMKSLKEAGYPNIPEITEQQNAQYQESAEIIQKELQQAGVSQKDLAEIQEGLAKGDLNIVVNEIVISKIKGLSTDRLENLIFGKNMTETELENLLDPDSKMKALLEKAKKTGKGFLLILLVALFGLGSNLGKGITSER